VAIDKRQEARPFDSPAICFDTRQDGAVLPRRRMRRCSDKQIEFRIVEFALAITSW